MKNLFFLFGILLISISTMLSAQSPIKPIVKKGRKYYYEDERLQTQDQFKSILSQCKNEQLMFDFNSGQKRMKWGMRLLTAGGVAVLANSALNLRDPNEQRYDLLLVGLGAEVLALGFVLNGRKKIDKAIKEFNLCE